MAVPPFIEVFDERFAKCIAQEQLGDDLVLSIELCLGLAGDAEKPGEGEVDDPANPGTRIFQKGLEDILFFPTRFMLNTKLTDIFKKWYPGGLPFSETTLTITWEPYLTLPVVCFTRNRSYISLVMPFPKEGEFVRLKDAAHFPGPQGNVDALVRSKGDEENVGLAYFHYMFGTDATLTEEEMRTLSVEQQARTLRTRKRQDIKNCIRAMVWDPRGFLHSIKQEQIKAKKDGALVTARMRNPTDDGNEEKGDKLKEKLRRMNMTIQISVSMMEQVDAERVEGVEMTAEEEAIGVREPILPSCNVGQAVYDPVSGTFILNGQHYTAANWPQQ